MSNFISCCSTEAFFVSSRRKAEDFADKSHLELYFDILKLLCINKDLDRKQGKQIHPCYKLKQKGFQQNGRKDLRKK